MAPASNVLKIQYYVQFHDKVVDNLLVMYYMHVLPKTKRSMFVKICTTHDVLIQEPIKKKQYQPPQLRYPLMFAPQYF